MASDQPAEIGRGGNHAALCSGGLESTVAAHISVRWGPCEILVYLDTKTGAESNRRFVKRVADTLGVPLFTIRTPESYEAIVRGEGFPGPAMHPKMYRCLKERSLGKLATWANGRGHTSELYLWTGVRLRESDQRMQHVQRVQEADRWTWVAPIYDWSDQEVLRYHRRLQLPRNHLWRTLGRSGDCFCGAFGSPEELLDAEAAGCDRLVERLRDLEASVARDDEKGRWAWGGMSEVAQRAVRAEHDTDQMALCSTCGRNPAVTDGGGDRGE